MVPLILGSPPLREHGIPSSQGNGLKREAGCDLGALPPEFTGTQGSQTDTIFLVYGLGLRVCVEPEKSELCCYEGTFLSEALEGLKPPLGRTSS